ncbi:SCO family protein [Dasania marina]|uniref:SCO family protein n=1 Tax=Dasania marina TaxID=471499 RepID=UPI0030DC7282|tara:strand:- start:27859 stop:28527 length:669 start_codon:yes stop_codon:yes gene_type:complete
MSDNNINRQQLRGIQITIAAVIGFIAIVLFVFIQGLSRTPILSKEEIKNNGAYLFEKARALEDFSLIKGDNSPFTPADLQGKWSLVFFGFTFCPDICPTTMAQLKQFYDKQEGSEFADDTQVILVSVDPGRDTPEKMQQYVKFFHSDFTGVTGEFLDIHRFATQLNIPFAKVPGGGENYMVDHSGNVAIINPHGHYVGFFRSPLNVTMMNKAYGSIRYWFED